MELRHLRYFVAVAEEGSLTVAAERRLHTAQPSLSRQIRDLEHEVGVKLLTRSARGIALTAAGQAFLDHARLALAQTDMAVQAARRAAQPDKPTFAVGFLTGHEMILLPEVMKILRDELPKIDVTVSSQSSPQLAEGLMKGRLDLAFLRPEPGMPELVYKVVMQEKLMVVMPSDHPLGSRTSIAIADVAQETFIGMSKTAPLLQAIIEDYLRRSGLDIRTQHEVDNLGMAISLVASTRGVTLLPAYAENFLPLSVISRPLAGEAPTIDLVIGYHASNTSPILKYLLSKCDELILRVNNKVPTA